MEKGEKVDSNREDFVKWFSELTSKDVKTAGGKGSSLAEMYNHKFPIPPGFMVTAQAYHYFISKAGIDKKIHELTHNLDVEDTDALTDASKAIREIIENSPLPRELEEEIEEAYRILDVERGKISQARGGAMDILKTGHEPPFVAVRSSATAEDLADASFAGQQESFLNVKGKADLLKKVRMCFSSLFTPRAIYYRTKKGFSHETTFLAVVVQRMVDSDKSGVMFSKNPIKDDDSITIEAVFGLGEGIVSGMIKPDHYVIDGNLEHFKLIECQVSDKKKAIVRDSSGKNQIVKLSKERSEQQVLTNYEIKRLAQYGEQLEEHYGKPQDIEFAIEANEIYIVQSRPITTKAKESKGEISGEILLSGLGASPGVGSGKVQIIHDLSEINKIKTGEILVTEMTNPDMVVAMQKAAGIITDEGGITSHAAIVSREMGIPCVVGTEQATKKLKDGDVVTVDGDHGKVYAGKGENKKVEVLPILPTKTKIKVIVDLPDYAERAALSHSKYVGLTRLEGIIAESGKHPMKFVKEKNMKAYIKIIYDGLKKIAAPFQEIWVRSSDIRTDEYKNLEGTPKTTEGNPMLGDHGIRFSLRHPEILKAELTAIKEVADDFPDKHVGFMMPQVINVSEVAETKRIAREEVGIPKNVKMGIMVETPAAVQVIKELCEQGIDFISFGTNDLTQYTLAIDRNNEEVQYLYNEMNPAVLNSIRYVIRTCKKYGVETSICGQAGSRPEMAEFLVREGIDSISVNADAAQKVSKIVQELENKHLNGVPSDEARKIGGESKKEEAKVPVKVREELPVVMHGSGKDIISKQGEDALNEDIENIVLKALDEGGNGKDEYLPGGSPNGKSEIPELNDAIVVSSDDLTENKAEEEVVIAPAEKEEEVLEEEWTGENKKVDIF